MTHYLKQILKGGIVAALALCVIYTGYTLWNGQKSGWMQAGYDQALTDLVNASEGQREINITAGEKTVKFVAIPPASSPPENP